MKKLDDKTVDFLKESLLAQGADKDRISGIVDCLVCGCSEEQMSDLLKGLVLYVARLKSGI
ncbi:hypothetical protein HAX39_25245 [Citrobacter freundii]|nr:hypothetical protein [Citrobacter freundii]